MDKYHFEEHTSDIKMHIYGQTLEDIFINSAQGMTEYLYGPQVLTQVPTTKDKIEIHSPDLESLLVDWLSELLYRSDANHVALITCSIKEIDNQHLKAGVKFCKAQAKEDIKAVTYNELKIEQKSDHWEAIIVYDI